MLNNRISEYLMMQLNAIGVPTHFVRRLNMREQLIKEVEIIPLEVAVRNVAAGSLSKRLGIEEGTALPRSIIEYFYKNDALHDPWVSEEHITAFGWASPQEIDEMYGRVNYEHVMPPRLALTLKFINAGARPLAIIMARPTSLRPSRVYVSKVSAAGTTAFTYCPSKVSTPNRPT